jgi:hypothetical protein
MTVVSVESLYLTLPQGTLHPSFFTTMTNSASEIFGDEDIKIIAKVIENGRKNDLSKLPRSLQRFLYDIGPPAREYT